MNVITNNNLKCTTALALLHNVYDPEIGLNVVDLGLIYQIDFDEDNTTIICSMTLTTQFCPMGESITDNVKNMLQSGFTGYTINVNLTFNPPWNYEMISEEGKIFLGR
ncbi:MAG: metal-sulfur cluster assembly factor [Bacteroidetes bacterium]|nr:metal-sulfur cluster assembly factor [Bacteroidota bacterium]MBS1642871.1 metal-sulfur cluster assembly factor [Bacteroidota bacterium]MBS1670359.1 metal-sulfur cluster assembly factor [Bacteroidota bacterium]